MSQNFTRNTNKEIKQVNHGGNIIKNIDNNNVEFKIVTPPPGLIRSRDYLPMPQSQIEWNNADIFLHNITFQWPQCPAYNNQMGRWWRIYAGMPNVGAPQYAQYRNITLIDVYTEAAAIAHYRLN
jgi:hypothetical protein